MKAPKLKRDWKGLQVVTRREMKNGFMTIPAGTKCTVVRNYAGLRLSTKPCELCGVSVFISKVLETDVRIIS